MKKTCLQLASVWLFLLAGWAGADAALDGRTLSWESGNRVVWRRTFPAALGNLTAPTTFQGGVYLGIGPVVYAYGTSGELLGRADLPGMVTSIDSNSGSVQVTTQGDGYTERFTLGDPTSNLSLPVVERVVMPPDPAITGWLARRADETPDAGVSRAAQDDPSNPFLALREAQLATKNGDEYEALRSVRHALNSQMPFYAWTQLAARLDTAGFPTAADLALERARRDAAQRGIDPEIPVSRAALAAFGNPTGYVGTLLSQNRLDRADVWMNFLRELYPRFEGGAALYSRYAAVLEAQGRAGEAEEWRQFARSLRSGSLYNLGPNDTSTVRDAARLTTFALLLALAAAYLALLARAWRAQGEDTKALGGRYRSFLQKPLSRIRLNILNYASLGERLTLAFLATALLVMLAGWQWANQTGQGLQAAALNMGTYGGGWYAAHLDELDLRATPDAALLAGLAAQLDGDDTSARELYNQVGQDACALNNLGVIAVSRDDEPQGREQYRAALTLRPDLRAAQYNLGLNPNTPEMVFQNKFRRGQPRLCYPDRRYLARMVSGDLSVTLARDLKSPLGFLSGEGPVSRLNWVVLGSLVLLVLLLFTLLMPRAASDSRLGRPALYRLCSVLFPGSALLADAWGSVLLATWAMTLLALAPLTRLVYFPFLPSPQQVPVRNALISLLVLVYLVNLLAVMLAEMRTARQNRLESVE